MAGKSAVGRLTGIYRWHDAQYDDDIEWTFTFEDGGSLDIMVDGEVQWDPVSIDTWMVNSSTSIDKVWPDD